MAGITGENLSPEGNNWVGCIDSKAVLPGNSSI
jgi:hypothetical protein